MGKKRRVKIKNRGEANGEKRLVPIRPLYYEHLLFIQAMLVELSETFDDVVKSIDQNLNDYARKNSNEHPGPEE